MRNSYKTLPITFSDTETYLNLPLYHRDPFDRLLIAQAMNCSLSVDRLRLRYNPFGKVMAFLL